MKEKNQTNERKHLQIISSFHRRKSKKKKIRMLCAFWDGTVVRQIKTKTCCVYVIWCVSNVTRCVRQTRNKTTTITTQIKNSPFLSVPMMIIELELCVYVFFSLLLIWINKKIASVSVHANQKYKWNRKPKKTQNKWKIHCEQKCSHKNFTFK